MSHKSKTRRLPPKRQREWQPPGKPFDPLPKRAKPKHERQASADWTCPTHKRRYPNEKKAELALRNVQDGLEVGNLQDTGRMPVRSYPCDKCGGWHLTAWTSEHVPT